MKTKLLVLAFAAALVPAARADFTVTLSHVHLCCNSCVKGVAKATTPIAGVAAESDKDAETITITAPDKATAQKAVDAIVAAGYFGVASDPAIKVDASTGAKDEWVDSLTVNGVHLCCNSCVEAVNDALAKVPGVKENTAKKNAGSFEVTGKFDAKAVFAALQAAGLTGRAGK